jgi:hypothetical protein
VKRIERRRPAADQSAAATPPPGETMDLSFPRKTAATDELSSWKTVLRPFVAVTT